MGGQVRYTPDGITLHLNIRTEHLSDEGFQSTELHNEELVVS